MESFKKKYPDSADYEVNIFGRFITGYGYNFEDATTRMETYHKWINETKIFSLKPESFTEISQRRPFQTLGRTKNGYTLVLLQLKNLFFTGNTPENVALYIGSYVIQAMKATVDPCVDRYIMILDIKDYTSDNFNKEGLQKLVPIFSNCFPDVLFRMYIVNVGFIASSIYSIVSMWFHEITRKKIQVIKENNDKIREAMKDEINHEMIPSLYGGGFKI